MQTVPRPTRRLERDRDNKVVAGVAAGLATHLTVRPLVVRLVFIALLLANGFGFVLYAAFWVFLPATGSGGRRRERLGTRISLVALALGVIILASQFGNASFKPPVVVLIAVVVIGAGIIWSQAESQRRRPAPAPAADRRWLVFRVIGGSLLLVVGIIGLGAFLLQGTASLSVVLLGMLFALLALTGVVVVFAPMLWRVFGQLGEERVARIREQERAEVAAVVHDQVLHTLALIQRNATDPARVQRLARGQERTLRGWLYQTSTSPTEHLAAALAQAAAEVEDLYGVVVEPVVVGDAPYDEALVGATREALVNAARHAGVHTISLYAEVEDEQVSVYVRDRGVGFDPATVDESRQGLRGSIVGRMTRHGGTATVRSAPGEGTEIALVMPRARSGASA